MSGSGNGRGSRGGPRGCHGSGGRTSPSGGNTGGASSAHSPSVVELGHAAPQPPAVENQRPQSSPAACSVERKAEAPRRGPVPRQWKRNKQIGASIRDLCVTQHEDAAKEKAREIIQDARDDAAAILKNARETAAADVKSMNLVRAQAPPADRAYILPAMPPPRGRISDIDLVEALAGWFEVSDRPWYKQAMAFVRSWSSFGEYDFVVVNDGIRLVWSFDAEGRASSSVHPRPFCEVERLPGDGRPVDHLGSPAVRNDPRICVVNVSCAKKLVRQMSVSATLFRELLAKFPKVDSPVDLGAVVTMATRMVGVNVVNESVLLPSGGVCDLSLVIYDTAVYFVHYHLRAVVTDRLFRQPEPPFSPLGWFGTRLMSAGGNASSAPPARTSQLPALAQPKNVVESVLATEPVKLLLTPFSLLSVIFESKLFWLLLLLVALWSLFVWAPLYLVVPHLPPILQVPLMQWWVPLNVLAVLSRLRLLGPFARYAISSVAGYVLTVARLPIQIFLDLTSGLMEPTTTKHEKTSFAESWKSILSFARGIYGASHSSSWSTIFRGNGSMPAASIHAPMPARPILVPSSRPWSTSFFSFPGLSSSSLSPTVPDTSMIDVMRRAEPTLQLTTPVSRPTSSQPLLRRLSGSSTPTYWEAPLLGALNSPGSSAL